MFVLDWAWRELTFFIKSQCQWLALILTFLFYFIFNIVYEHGAETV